MKYSRLEARGDGPTPETCHVSPVRASCTRIGATPATLTMSGWTTPSVNPAATPASIALPAAPRTRAPASAASEWPAATAQRVPIVCTVEVGRCPGARCCEEAESRLMAIGPLLMVATSYRERLGFARGYATHRHHDVDHGRHGSRARLRQRRLHPGRAGGRRHPGVAHPALHSGRAGTLVGAAGRARANRRR